MQLMFGALLVLTGQVQAANDQPLEFNRDVRAILSDRCFQCHGPDEKKREAELRLDDPASALRDLGGYHAILPGQPDNSELIARIESTDPDYMMPPPESGKSLSDADKLVFNRWIKEGAPFEKHWSFASITRPEIAASDDDTWSRNDIDRFVLKKLKAAGLPPAPRASRETLIRRLSLDLTGLLPTPEEVDRFVSDKSSNAYEDLVDRLLASKHFGERFARHWLDLARYADSNGYANDGLRSIWPYRDWVIKALNDDMPFDQFTIEQLAGDLLPNPTTDQLIATGFHRNTPHQTEGGSDPEQYRVERTKNRTDTTGAVWFGLTVGCAQCHTHKFDPITHAEYYQLYAFFNNADEPKLPIKNPEQEAEIEAIEQEIAALTKKIESASKLPNATQPTHKASEQPWAPLELTEFNSEEGATLKRLSDGSILASGKNPSIDTYVLVGELKQPAKVLQIETMTHKSLPGTGPGRAGNGNFVLADLQVIIDDEPVKIIDSVADHHQSGHPPTKAYNGNSADGWAINVKSGSIHQNRKAYFQLAHEVEGKIEIRIRTYDKGNGYNIGRLRLSTHFDAGVMSTLQKGDDNPLIAQRDELQNKKAALEKKLPSTMIMSERDKPRNSFVQIRGDFLDPGPAVKPGTFRVLHAWQPPKDREANRLDLANWIMDPANPLTARVQANRMWQHLFGVGLVETENDFGYQGATPTLPGLLDHLATELTQNGWRLKPIYKQIVMSATYQQSSAYRQDAAAIDPANHLHSHQRRFRVEAEVVRDVALCASGLLSDKIGGPSVFPPIPEGVIGTSSAKHRWPESKGEDRLRRGLYTAVYRANVYPMLKTFDGPDRDNACTRRSQSNTPLQALTLANDRTFMEAAVALAKRITANASIQSNRDKIGFGFKLCMSRSATDQEMDRLLTFHLERENFYTNNIDQAKAICSLEDPTLAAWTATARVLMNVDEFITRE